MFITKIIAGAFVIILLGQRFGQETRALEVRPSI